jgi:uncharacterized protein YceK
MSTKRLAVVFSSLCVVAVLCLSGCASSDMRSKDDAMQKPMMKDSGKSMDDKMDTHDDMNGSM